MQFTITIESYVPPGIGLGHHQGKAVFVRSASPGDELLVEVTKEKKDHLEARILEVVNASPERRESPCPHYLACGGCDLLQLEYPEQLALKARMFQETFASHGLEWTGEVIPSPQVKHYRTKANLKAGNGQVGFNRLQSGQVIDVPQCLILAEPIKAAIGKLKTLGEVNADYPILSSLTKGTVAAVKAKGKRQESCPGFPFALREDYGFGEMELWAANFAQANASVTKLMTRAIFEAALGHELAVELYAGSGTLTFALAQAAGQVLAYEESEKAVKVLKRNLELLKLDNVKAWAMDSKKVKPPKNADLILLDPPRAGAEDGVIEQILKSSAKRVIYMSCNPATLARDLAKLHEDFTTLGVTPYDMYPHSTHLEALAILQRR